MSQTVEKAKEHCIIQRNVENSSTKLLDKMSKVVLTAPKTGNKCRPLCERMTKQCVKNCPHKKCDNLQNIIPWKSVKFEQQHSGEQETKNIVIL